MERPNGFAVSYGAYDSITSPITSPYPGIGTIRPWVGALLPARRLRLLLGRDADHTGAARLRQRRHGRRGRRRCGRTSTRRTSRPAHTRAFTASGVTTSPGGVRTSTAALQWRGGSARAGPGVGRRLNPERDRAALAPRQRVAGGQRCGLGVRFRRRLRRFRSGEGLHRRGRHGAVGELWRLRHRSRPRSLRLGHRAVPAVAEHAGRRRPPEARDDERLRANGVERPRPRTYGPGSAPRARVRLHRRRLRVARQR